MKKMQKISMTLLFALLLILSVIPSYAAAPVYFEPLSVTLYPEKDQLSTDELIAGTEGKVTNLKSSNPAIFKVLKYEFDGYTSIFVSPKKSGSAYLSFKVDGKAYKKKVIVKKYTSPIDSITIGKAKITGSKYKKTSIYHTKYAMYQDKKLKTMVKLTSDWELEKYMIYSTGSMANAFFYLPANGESMAIKNGGYITFEGGNGTVLCINVKHKTMGRRENVWVYFD